MKIPDLRTKIMSVKILDDFLCIFSESRQQKLPLQLFFLLCLNLLIAPAVQAATGGEISRLQSYAIAFLGLVTLCISIYLFVVIFQPERF